MGYMSKGLFHVCFVPPMVPGRLICLQLWIPSADIEQLWMSYFFLLLIDLVSITDSFFFFTFC